jgi:hypothetical protein
MMDILTMHLPINVKSPNNISKWQMGFNSAFKWLIFIAERNKISIIIASKTQSFLFHFPDTTLKVSYP